MIIIILDAFMLTFLMVLYRRRYGSNIVRSAANGMSNGMPYFSMCS